VASIWGGTVKDLKGLLRGGNFTRELAGLYERTYGAPSPQEERSWEPSFRPFLGQVLAGPEFDSLQALVEMQMPVGAERADLVLLGGTPSAPKGYVLEFKLWSGGTVSQQSLEVTVPGLGVHQHPSVQALNYRGKLKLFHTRAASYDVRAAVYLPNLGAAGRDALAAPLPRDVSLQAPLFARADAAALAEAIRSHLLPCGLAPREHADFDGAPYGQTRHLFDVLTKHARDIADRAVTALAESGIGLTQEQEVLVEEVLAAARRPRGEVFIVQGGPGSGKTLLAVSLLLRALERGLRCVLAIRNNRLQAILRRCFDASYRGASGTLMYFEVKQYGTGIGDARFGGSFDLVICDEAQRMRAASMPVVLGRAPVSAIFLDETQRLNPPEEGTLDAFSGAARAVPQRTPQVRRLTAAVRCRGGRPYMDWVERLLVSPPGAGAPASQPWARDYEFALCDSAEGLIAGLRALRERDGGRVALVASFTESPGAQNVNSPDNLRVGHPLTSGWDLYRGRDVSLRWLMKPEEYARFWMRGGSNELDRVASIYGAQGFESDYVGVIWGRDFVCRSGGWQLGPPAACYDTTDGLVKGGAQRRAWADGALELVRNRYRIFLTRGIKGTLVFFEDEETRAAVRSALGA
jgi:DUF2075 family protein